MEPLSSGSASGLGDVEAYRASGARGDVPDGGGEARGTRRVSRGEGASAELSDELHHHPHPSRYPPLAVVRVENEERAHQPTGLGERAEGQEGLVTTADRHRVDEWASARRHSPVER